jgi:hypothetical protein
VHVKDRTQVTHYSYGFILINDETTAVMNNPTENDRRCGMEGLKKFVCKKGILEIEK